LPGRGVRQLKARLGLEHPDTVDLQSILNSVKHLPPRGEPDPVRAEEARVECAVIRRRLIESRKRFPEAAAAVRAVAAKLAGTPGDPASFGPLDGLLAVQAYRPAFWRVASREIHSPRFFDVKDLAAVLTEREDVFGAVHKKLFAWLAAGDADGLRIDPPDGLFDPKQSLTRLQGHYPLAIARVLHEQKPDA